MGFAHGLFNIRAKPKEGDAVDYWIRVTLGFRKQAGQWKVVHDHASVPFDMKSTKAMLGLKP